MSNFTQRSMVLTSNALKPEESFSQMFFLSDNAGSAHPHILCALQKANQGYAPPYGGDELTQTATARIRALFDAPDAAVYFVSTGTAANALALATLGKPWESIFCHRQAHVAVDECGAPEFFSGGAKLTLIDGGNGKIDGGALLSALGETADHGVHGVQRGPISLTQITETGTLYSITELEAITAIAREFGVGVHMDGARFANACAALGVSPADMTWRAGIDVLSFGGTKNGLLAAEAVIFFDSKHAWEFELRRKRGGHLFSKNRFLAAQMAAYVEDGLWLETARIANENAQMLSEGIRALPDAALLHECEGNMVFATLPRRMHRKAIAEGAQYYLIPMQTALEGDGDEKIAARFVCDWSLERTEIARFLELIAGA